MRTKYTAKWGARIVGMIFQIRSDICKSLGSDKSQAFAYIKPDCHGKGA
ncbi:MAG: DUF6783 domain-containing protein [Blautia wexlerae]